MEGKWQGCMEGDGSELLLVRGKWAGVLVQGLVGKGGSYGAGLRSVWGARGGTPDVCSIMPQVAPLEDMERVLFSTIRLFPCPPVISPAALWNIRLVL